MKLKEWLKRFRVTNRKLAKDLGICQQTVSHLSKEKRYPSLVLFAAIHKYTHGEVTIEDLLNEEDRKYLNEISPLEDILMKKN